MLVAVPEFKGRVAPTFDFCHKVTLWRIDEKGVRGAGHRQCKGLASWERAPKLKSLGVDLLLCGAIGKEVEDDIRSLGIEVIGGLAGEVMEVISAYRCRALDESRFKMPGVSGKRNSSSSAGGA